MNTQLSHDEIRTETGGEGERGWPGRSVVWRSRKWVSENRTLVVLAVCMALQMTGFVIGLPLFARRFGELGAGVEALSASVMAGALAGTLAAPFMGGLADRFGRRRMVLGALGVYVVGFGGYLVAESAAAFIVLRGVVGALTAGLVPAIFGMVADLAPTDRRGQWAGMVSGGASFGWIAGPILGGVFYDRWGYSAAIGASMVMAGVTLGLALVGIPETRREERWVGQGKRGVSLGGWNWKAAWEGARGALGGQVGALGGLMAVSFAVMFAWAFIEPSFMFYAYEGLGWSSGMLGLVMSTYGIAMMAGEFGLSQISDRVGRKPVIVAGVALFGAQFLGLALAKDYGWIALSFVVAGLGNALFDPALSAAVMDITPQEHQGRVQGIKSMAGSLGNILGPALAMGMTQVVEPQGIFWAAVGVVGVTMGVAMVKRS